MNNIFAKIPKNLFLILAALINFAGDLLICYYLYLKFSQFDYFSSYFLKKLDPGLPVDTAFLNEQFQIFQQALINMLILLMIVHGIVYVFYAIGKKKAIRYAQMLYFITVPSTLFLVFVTQPLNIYLPWMFGLQFILYLFVWWGVRFFALTTKFGDNFIASNTTIRRTPSGIEN